MQNKYDTLIVLDIRNGYCFLTISILISLKLNCLAMSKEPNEMKFFRLNLHRIPLFLAISGFCFILTAGPKISIDSEEYDAGEIMEGERTVVTHTFILKNTGDSTLVIDDVKPG
jgi:hypothetical protein